jgi:myo-inositol-1(or 4)-monophosphatase
MEEGAFQETLEIIRRLGDQARSEQGRITREHKADGTCVTPMDREIESQLRAFLHSKFPMHQVLGEEGGLSGPTDGNATWVIDPIDGTANYSLGLPIWSVSVGLLVGGTPQWGCVYIPSLGMIFLAQKGRGATRNGEPIAPLKRNSLQKEDIIGITSDGARYYDYRFPQKIRAMGSAAAQVVFVACGNYVAYFLDEWYVWDIAAALLIAREAGARVTDDRGVDVTGFRDLGPQKGLPLLFGAPGIHEAILPLIHLREKEITLRRQGVANLFEK